MNDIERKVIEEIVINTVKKLMAEKDAPNRVPLGVSNKHLHLTQEHVEILFGKGHQLTNLKDVKQPGQFACEECVKIIGPKGEFPKVRVLGPARSETQIELSMTDARTLGVNVPIRESGKLEGTPGLTIDTVNVRYTRLMYLNKFDKKDGKKAPLADERVRQAIAYALDMKSILDLSLIHI